MEKICVRLNCMAVFLKNIVSAFRDVDKSSILDLAHVIVF